MSSDQIYYTYYSPTDVQHPNKVKYTDNLSAAGDILVTSSSGFDNLNTRPIITSSWGDGIQKQNDFNYNVSITNGFKYGYEFKDSLQYVGTNSNMNNTVARQLTIDDFNYDTIFGLTRANPAVVDYNYYRGETANVFGDQGSGKAVIDIETTRIGPKAFVFNSTEKSGGLNDYSIGRIVSSLPYGITTKIDGVKNSSIGFSRNNLINNYYGKTLSWNGNVVENINGNTLLYDIEQAWPYKVQYNSSQWYQILTNGQQSALLTLPYWYNDPNTATANNQERFYILSTKLTNGKQSFNYYKLDKIVENNYYYIVSYFDTRPTVSTPNNILFNSNCTSLFNENLIQVLPLTRYDYSTFESLHDVNEASNMASCNPISYTVSNPPITPIIAYQSDIGGNSYPDNLGLNPIAIKYEKNITITTTLNYTVANMTNLGNILTGWNYLHRDYSSDNVIISRGNLPYINVGIIIYIPTTNPDYDILRTTPAGELAFNSNNKYVRFCNWMREFGYNDFWRGNNAKGLSSEMPSALYNIYMNIANGTYIDNDFKWKYSTPACIRFNSSNVSQVPAEDLHWYDDHIPTVTTVSAGNETADSRTTFYWNDGNISTTGADLIKFVNVLNAPINNALDTTHSVSDNYTFRLSKTTFAGNAKDVTNTDYFYIIGTYIYITKNVDVVTSEFNPHYLGFSPSTNITLKDLATGSNNYRYNYTYPYKSIKAFMNDSTNPTTTYETNISKTSYGHYALMKDIFVTPSLFMTINESVGDV